MLAMLSNASVEMFNKAKLASFCAVFPDWNKYLCSAIIFNHVKFLKDLTCWFFATLFSMIFLFNVLTHWYQKHRKNLILIIIVFLCSLYIVFSLLKQSFANLLHSCMYCTKYLPCIHNIIIDSFTTHLQLFSPVWTHLLRLRKKLPNHKYCSSEMVNIKIFSENNIYYRSLK